jgi:SAM-dependent methyltransferase
MIDIFGQDVTEGQLAAWDRATVDLWNARGAQLWCDAEEQSDELFWETELLVPRAMVKDAQVLELGCGVGRCAAHVAAAGGRYWGLDHSRVAVQVARGRYREWEDVVFSHTVWQAEAAWDNGFDIIFGTSFFIHQGVSELDIILDHARRWLCAGGLLSMDFWPGDGPQPGQAADWPICPLPADIWADIERRHGLALTRITPAIWGGRRRYAILRKVTP